jgi:hypothetical protein
LLMFKKSFTWGLSGENTSILNNKISPTPIRRVTSLIVRYWLFSIAGSVL